MGWNSESGPFSVTINLGKSAAIGSVKLITHADQGAGVNWPSNVSASIGATCAPQNEGITGQSCTPAGTSGQATLSSHLVVGGSSAYDTAGTITLPMSSVTGQYVTITGTCSYWCLFDEMQVLSPTGTVLSTGDTYTVTPQPTNGPGGGVTYGDDDYKLTDGNIIPTYGAQFADALDGMTANAGGTVQATWATPHTATTATIWMTAPSNTYGVILPPSVAIHGATPATCGRPPPPSHPAPAADPPPAPVSPSRPAHRSPESKPPSPAAAPPPTGTSSARSAPSKPQPATRWKHVRWPGNPPSRAIRLSEARIRLRNWAAVTGGAPDRRAARRSFRRFVGGWAYRGWSEAAQREGRRP